VEGGKEPYGDMTVRDAVSAVKAGYRLPQPPKEKCSDTLWEIVTKCWNTEPEQRPSFLDLFKFLEDCSTTVMYFVDFLLI